MEADPGTFDRRRIDAWADIGLTRLSVGIQSFDADSLARLGRSHDAAQAREAARLVAGSEETGLRVGLGGTRGRGAPSQHAMRRRAAWRGGAAVSRGLVGRAGARRGERQRGCGARGRLRAPVL